MDWTSTDLHTAACWQDLLFHPPLFARPRAQSAGAGALDDCDVGITHVIFHSAAKFTVAFTVPVQSAKAGSRRREPTPEKPASPVSPTTWASTKAGLTLSWRPRWNRKRRVSRKVPELNTCFVTGKVPSEVRQWIGRIGNDQNDRLRRHADNPGTMSR